LKAPECLAFVMSVGTISERAPQVDDALAANNTASRSTS
jgi:hypothetical protein